MVTNNNEDMRVKRTKENIKRAFAEMICEMDYEAITVKELTDRAGINRKTFYLHYPTLDDLLREMQNEMAQNFINRTKNFKRPQDMDKITKEFFFTCEELGELGERITCSGNYQYISRRITSNILNTAWSKDNRNPYIQNLIKTFVSQSTLELYKQWISDGKVIPLEDMIKITTELICRGVNDIEKRI